MLPQIKAPQFYTDSGLHKKVLNPLQIVKFKDFSRSLSVFQVLFKANLVFKDFLRRSCIFKYFKFQACANPVLQVTLQAAVAK